MPQETMITLKNAREYALRWVKWLANGYATEIVIKSNLEASGRQYGAGYLEVRSCLLDKKRELHSLEPLATQISRREIRVQVLLV